MAVAIVHDYLNQFGGAERVALELLRTWPGSPLYTSLYRPQSTFPEFADRDLRLSPLNAIPVDKGFRSLAPLYPLAFRSFGTLSEDVVISSSSGWAHGVRTAPQTLHIVYCHTPSRWLYYPTERVGSSIGRALLRPINGRLRRWDRAAARRSDIYVASCEHVRQRIKAVYGLEAVVIQPPVDVQRFAPKPRGERLLVVSRLLPYKHVDLVVRTATRAGLGLDVVGTGPRLEYLRSIAGPTVAIHGRVDDTALKELFENARAVCVAATEDFGIVPVEAAAAGKPVIAFGQGGVLETVEEGFSGTFFYEHTEAALLAAIARADRIDTPPVDLASHALRYSAEHFRIRMRTLVTEAWAQRRAPAALPSARPALQA